MGIFEVLNVGQGDCIIVRPPYKCRYHEKTFFIDLGPGNIDITKYISGREKVNIYLSHHHKDHMGGLIYFANKINQIEEIIVPFHQNEITLIAQAILNLKGIRSSDNCSEFINALEEIVNNQVIIKSLTEGNKMCPKLSFIYEGKRFCQHIKCLNPPIHINVFDWIGEADIENIIELFHDMFTPSFSNEMENYVRTYSHRKENPDFVSFGNFWIQTEDDAESQHGYNKCNYVLNFIMNNIPLFLNFNNNSTRKNLKRIYNKYLSCTHDVCMVLMTSFGGEKMLLTGDASKNVFKRLINENKDIRATYLKMPHHGSKRNINEKILKHINPKVAIISHNNGHFGTSKDTHPNIEVLEYLQKMGVKILLTNDIIKGNCTYMKKNNHCDDDYVVIR